MERKEYFAQEIELSKQNVRDARLLVWGEDQLIRRAEKIAKVEWERHEKKLLDFV